MLLFHMLLVHFSRPVGMVVAPLCWKANEWIGLAVGCQISEIMSSLRKVFQGSAFEDERGSGDEECIYAYNWLIFLLFRFNSDLYFCFHFNFCLSELLSCSYQLANLNIYGCPSDYFS